jgi:hypothetical protein
MDCLFSWECLTQALNSTLIMHLTHLLPATLGFAITCAAVAAPQPTALAVVPRLSSNEYISYTTVTGFFLQDEPTTNSGTFDYVRYTPSERMTTNLNISQL